ncbi:MAG: pyridoxamine 5'-phosphate oxidase family protein [Lacisediminihabitans sp.]
MAQAADPVVENLTPEECWALLGENGIGRLATAVVEAVTGRISPDIFPVNYLVHERAVLFRSAPGSKLIDLTRQPAVAFQVDGRVRRDMWSVVVHGDAERMGFDSEIEESGIRELQASHPTDKWNYVRIGVREITGIRFREN